MAKVYGLNESDRRKLADVIRRVNAGSTNHRTHKRRRGPFGGGGNAKAKASLEGGFAIIKGTVPASAGISLGGLVDVSEDGDPIGAQVVTPGLLEKDTTGGAFAEGALLVNPDGTVILEPDPDFAPLDPNADPPEEAPLIPAVRDVVNPSFTDFVATGGVFTGGAIATQETDDGEGGTVKVNTFILPAFDLRSLPKHNASAEGQAPYHPQGSDSYELGREDC